MYFDNCPRCGFRAYETLSTHSHCIDCGFGAVHDVEAVEQIPQWALDFLESTESETREAPKLAEAA